MPVEAIFENETVLNQTQYIALYWNLYGKKDQKNALIMVAILAALILAWGKLDRYMLILSAIYIVLIVRALTSYRRNAQKAYLRRLEYFDNSLPPVLHFFYDDYFEVRGTDSTRTTPYRKISQVQYLKDIMIIYRKDGQVFCMDTTAFTKGDYESFARFLREKTAHLNPAQEQEMTY